MESCKECGEESPLVDGLCPDCLEETFVCDNCGERYSDDEKTIINSKNYCTDCVDNEFTRCYDCEELIPNDEITDVNNRDICECCLDNNYFVCNYCSEWSHNSSEIPYYDGSLCTSCYEDNFFTCDSCNEIYHVDNHDGDGYCCNCGGESSCLHSYSYKPCPVFYGESKENLFFGVELEIESDGNSFEDIVENLPDFLYAKEDSSMNEGFEIVSHPTSWNWLIENSKQWNKILDLRKEGFKSYNTSTCGMHVHMSKRAFGSLHLYKFLKLFFENQEFILTVSRRKKYLLEQYASLETDESIVYKAKTKYNDDDKGRYTAVNLRNDETVEVRIFRGTLHPEGFWRNIEFCKAAYDYTKNESIKNINANSFCKFIEKNKKEYFNLFTFLRKKKLCV